MLADGFNTKILRVATEKNLLVRWIIGNGTSHVDGTIDEVPFQLEERRLACILDKLLVKEGAREIDFANRTDCVVRAMGCVGRQPDLFSSKSRVRRQSFQSLDTLRNLGRRR